MPKLESELAYFAENVEAWAQQYSGQFVVVKNRRLLGTFATLEEALAAGAREYGLADFLVRQLGRTPETVSVPALSLGLLSAHP